MNEEEVRKSFNDVSRCTVSTKDDVRELLNTARSTLEDTNLDWDRRQKALKSIRSIVINGGMDFEKELLESLRLLEDGLCKSVADLRSQVCKEACITNCMLAEEFGSKLSRLFERLLPVCIPLIQNSAKIMANSGSLASSFIVRNVHTPRIMSILMEFKQHKSNQIRSNVFLLVASTLSSWPPQKLEKHLDDIVAVIRLALGDADPNGRKNGRDGYQQLEVVFPRQAELLFKSLDASKQKTITGRASATASCQSLTSLRGTTPLKKRPGATSSNSRPTTGFLSGRSVSAIDSSAVTKAINAEPKSSITSVPIRRTPVTSLRTRNNSQPSSPTEPKYRLDIDLLTPSPVKFDQKKAPDSVLKQITNLSLNGQEEDDWFAVGAPTESTLRNAVKKCAKADPLAKKEGLTAIHEILRTSPSLSAAEVNVITEALIKLLAEHSHKMVNQLTEVLCDVVSQHHGQIRDHLFSLLSRLLPKYSQEIMPNVRMCFKKLLDQTRISFGHSEQLAALCQFIDGQMTSPHTPKARLATVTYLLEVVEAMETGSDINHPEVQAAVTKMFQWMEDPKNYDVKPICEQLISAFFKVNAADFSSIVAQFPPAWKDHAFSFLDERMDNESSVTEVPVKMEMVSPNPSLGPLFNNSCESVDVNMSILETTHHLGADDHQQNEFIKRKLKELATASTDPSRFEDQHTALSVLQQMVSEGSFTTWDKNFNPLLLQLFDLLALGTDKKSMQLKKDSLRLIGKLSTTQAARFSNFGQMVITRVLNAAAGVDDNWFRNVVDECLRTFSSHLPIDLILSTLIPIIASNTDPRIASSVKMLQRLVEQGDADSLKKYLADFVPAVVECYNSTDPNVRRNTVLTLAALVCRFGREEINPYFTPLEQKTVRLINVYIEKTQ